MSWLHVDGAMAGIAALAPEFRWVNDGLEFADSYCTNPHKWMGVNFDCTTYWTSDRSSLLGALSILPEYLRSAAAETGAVIDYRDWQVPLGRRFRALKLWFTIRCEGIEAFRRMIRDHVAMTQQLADVDRRRRPLRDRRAAPAQPGLRRADGEATRRPTRSSRPPTRAKPGHFTRTVLDGRSVLRISIGARTTTPAHVTRHVGHPPHPRLTALTPTRPPSGQRRADLRLGAHPHAIGCRAAWRRDREQGRAAIMLA